jgi:hypothetical protein
VSESPVSLNLSKDILKEKLKNDYVEHLEASEYSE